MSPLTRLSFTVIFALLCAPLLASGRESQVVADIPYKAGPTLSEYEIERCKLDLHLPAAEGDFPTLVWFHGGSLTGGARTDAAGFARRLADAGVAVATVGYRLSPHATFPAYIEDAAAAFAWVRAHIAEHGGDTHAVFIGGHSAGGYLTLMVGMDPRFLQAHGLGLDAIAGLVPVSAQTMTHYTVREERGLDKDIVFADAAAPVHYARNAVPPLLVLWASDDLAARGEENLYLVALLRAAGRTPVASAVMPHRDHGTILSDIDRPDDELIGAVLNFIRARAHHSAAN